MGRIVLVLVCGVAVAVQPACSSAPTVAPSVSWTCPGEQVKAGATVDITYNINRWTGGTPATDAVKALARELQSDSISSEVELSWISSWQPCGNPKDCTRRRLRVKFKASFTGARIETTVKKSYGSTGKVCRFTTINLDGGVDASKKIDAQPKKDAPAGDAKPKADGPLKDKPAKTDKVYCDLASTSVFYPAADTYIRAGTYQTTNYGKSTSLFVKSRTFLDNFSRKTYLVFDLATVKTKPTSATLSLTIAKHPAKLSMVHGLYGITDNKDWDPGALAETAINWANAPKNDTASAHLFLDQGTAATNAVRLITSQNINAADPAGTVYNFDVTAYVNWALGYNSGYASPATSDSDKKITLMLSWTTPPSANADGFGFASKEATCGRPLLTIK